MHSYIAIQNTYDLFEVALFINNKLHSQLQEDKRHTSKHLVPFLDQLLAQNNVSFSDLSFIVVNQGPGPFSTLRSVIATVNGLHCATQIPLIGIDGLEATLSEFYNPAYPYTIVLLNAFNAEVYYAISHNQQILGKGYKKIDLFLQNLAEQFPSQAIRFIGNGVDLYKALIKEKYQNAIIDEKNPSLCTLNHIGTLGLALFADKNRSDDYLFPLYLKKHAVEEKRD